MSSIYHATSAYPYHVSVGAVIVNDQGEVLCHYFKTLPDPLGHHDDVYILMRETLEPGEGLEHAVRRGAMEEFGATVDITHVLISKLDTIGRPEDRFVWQKTTIYFLCKLTDWEPSRRDADDLEAGSELVWRRPEFLIEHMRRQGERTGRDDLDESTVLEVL